jgi:hypothetical protein
MSEPMTPDEYAAMQSGGELPGDYVEFAKLMVHDKRIPKDVKDDFWGFINKETILSKTDDGDRRRAENRFIILRNLKLMSEPYYKIDIDKIKSFQNVQQRNSTQILRSHQGFERSALTTQIKQVITNQKKDYDRNGNMFSGLMKKMGIRQGGGDADG